MHVRASSFTNNIYRKYNNAVTRQGVIYFPSSSHTSHPRSIRFLAQFKSRLYALLRVSRFRPSPLPLTLRLAPPPTPLLHGPLQQAQARVHAPSSALTRRRERPGGVDVLICLRSGCESGGSGAGEEGRCMRRKHYWATQALLGAREMAPSLCFVCTCVRERESARARRPGAFCPLALVSCVRM